MEKQAFAALNKDFSVLGVLHARLAHADLLAGKSMADMDIVLALDKRPRLVLDDFFMCLENIDEHARAVEDSCGS